MRNPYDFSDSFVGQGEWESPMTKNPLDVVVHT